MKIVYWILGSFFAVILLFIITERLASERIEVVELHTNDASGEKLTTRLWIVDHDGYPYLRTGDDQAGWYQRLEAQEKIELTRDGTTAAYKTMPEPARRNAVNELMQQKYTWGDTFIGMVFGRDDAIPIRLEIAP